MVDYDAVVVGGGPAGATAAADLAASGVRTLLLDREDRIKPCGGAIPPRLLEDFAVPAELLAARVGGARIIAPSGRSVDMAIDGSFVGMVERDRFDPWLRRRAAAGGADRVAGRYETLRRLPDGTISVAFRTPDAGPRTARCRLVVGADGANSLVRRDALGPTARPPYVFAYHEIVRAPAGNAADLCEVHYRGEVSPDFYGWVFPHGDTLSIGTGSAVKGFDLKAATRRIRQAAGLAGAETVREEGAPLPLRPLRRWDDGRAVLLAGDAAGIVAPASGEGIYYAMLSGRLAAQAGLRFLKSGDAAALRQSRRRFMRDHGRIFLILRLMQGFWYKSDRRRERFVAICRDPDVQRLTWQSYLDKRLATADPLAHLRVAVKDLGHLLRLIGPDGAKAGHDRAGS